MIYITNNNMLNFGTVIMPKLFFPIVALPVLGFLGVGITYFIGLKVPALREWYDYRFDLNLIKNAENKRDTVNVRLTLGNVKDVLSYIPIVPTPVNTGIGMVVNSIGKDKEIINKDFEKPQWARNRNSRTTQNITKITVKDTIKITINFFATYSLFYLPYELFKPLHNILIKKLPAFSIFNQGEIALVPALLALNISLGGLKIIELYAEKNISFRWNSKEKCAKDEAIVNISGLVIGKLILLSTVIPFSFAILERKVQGLVKVVISNITKADIAGGINFIITPFIKGLETIVNGTISSLMPEFMDENFEAKNPILTNFIKGITGQFVVNSCNALLTIISNGSHPYITWTITNVVSSLMDASLGINSTHFRVL